MGNDEYGIEWDSFSSQEEDRLGNTFFGRWGRTRDGDRIFKSSGGTWFKLAHSGNYIIGAETPSIVDVHEPVAEERESFGEFCAGRLGISNPSKATVFFDLGKSLQEILMKELGV